MKKVILLFLVSMSILILSCDGVLWSGNRSSNGSNFTINIPSPYPESRKTSTARAIALQGKFLYIELARIDNQDLYTPPVLPVTENGFWVETEWGGHAVFTIDMVDLEDIEAYFTGIPLGQDLVARVILDESSLVVGDILAGNREGNPICQTYNENGIWGEAGIDITVSDLAEGEINLPIRPGEILNANWESLNNSNYNYSHYNNYSESSIELPSNVPNFGETVFIELDLIQRFDDFSESFILEDEKVRDVAYYCLAYGESVSQLDIPNTVSLYGKDGAMLSIGEDSIIELEIEGTTYLHRSLAIGKVIVDEDYTNPGCFMGSSLLLTEQDLVSNFLFWNVRYGVLYDPGFYANIDANDFIVINFEWEIPSGISTDDLEYKIISIQDPMEWIEDESYLETIDEIYIENKGLEIKTICDWSNFSVNLVEDNLFRFNEIVDSPPFGDGSWVIILARTPDGSPFIYGRYLYQEEMGDL